MGGQCLRAFFSAAGRHGWREGLGQGMVGLVGTVPFSEVIIVLKML
jgi:hypothetical protein